MRKCDGNFNSKKKITSRKLSRLGSKQKKVTNTPPPSHDEDRDKRGAEKVVRLTVVLGQGVVSGSSESTEQGDTSGLWGLTGTIEQEDNLKQVSFFCGLLPVDNQHLPVPKVLLTVIRRSAAA